MYRLSSNLIVGIVAVSTLGVFSSDTGSQPVVGARPQNISDSVNRIAKGDRLYVPSAQSYQAWKDEFNARVKGQYQNSTPGNARKPDAKLTPKEMPVGCEPAVSIALDDILAKIPSRCVSSVPSSSFFASLAGEIIA